jgi:hypothetical protein
MFFSRFWFLNHARTLARVRGFFKNQSDGLIQSRLGPPCFVVSISTRWPFCNV